MFKTVNTRTTLCQTRRLFYSILLIVPVFFISCGEDGEDGLDGMDGIDGVDGSDGTNGENGLNVLFNTSDEPAGVNCSNGGLKVDYGQDINENGVLEDTEVQGTSFICNGTSQDPVLVVTVDEPSGDNCADGGVKLLVGVDENGNGILETEEVDNIAFICNGEDAEATGKTFVVLSGDLTNEQAASIIARDLGSNTQFISIIFTSRLTSVDLSGADNLVEILIENNQDLETVIFPDLVEVSNFMAIFQNPSLNELDFSALRRLRGGSISSNDNVQTIDFTSLDELLELEINESQLINLSLGNITKGDVTITGGAFNSLDFSNLTTVAELNLTLSGTNLTNLDLSNLINIGDLSITRTSLLDLDLSQMVTCGELTLSDNLITDVNLDQLLSSGVISIIRNNSLLQLSMPLLIDIFQEGFDTGIRVENNDALTTFNVNSLSTLARFVLRGNGQLNSVNFDNVSDIPVDIPSNFYAMNNNNFDSNTVNYLLGVFTNFNPTLMDASINLAGQATDAPPTGQGLTDKATLQSNGNTVTTD